MIGMVFDLFAQKIKVVDCYMTNLQYSYKQPYIRFFFNHGPQVLTTSV